MKKVTNNVDILYLQIGSLGETYLCSFTCSILRNMEPIYYRLLPYPITKVSLIKVTNLHSHSLQCYSCVVS